MKPSELMGLGAVVGVTFMLAGFFDHHPALIIPMCWAWAVFGKGYGVSEERSRLALQAREGGE